MYELIVGLLLLVSNLSLVFLQTSRSMLLRSLGIFVILITSVLYFVAKGSPSSLYVMMVFIPILSSMAFLSDYAYPSLRTWYHMVSSKTITDGLYGSFIFLLISNVLRLSIPEALLLGTGVGLVVGEVRHRKEKNIKFIGKSVSGGITGMFGMSTKVLLGFIMTSIIVRTIFSEIA
ncbi:MAG: hypothetical protein ACK4IX_09905 [Candidatus Sericytochromatia bacterium]